MELPYRECTMFNFMDRKRRLTPIRLDVPVNYFWSPAVVPIIVSDEEGSAPPEVTAATMNRPKPNAEENQFDSKFPYTFWNES